MSTWAVVPVKQFASAKTRLHTVLSSASRAAIARSMARDVLAALAAAHAEVVAMTHNIFHLDGRGVARHLDAILELPNVNAIQWVQGVGRDQPILQWVPLIRKIQAAGKSVVVDMTVAELEPFMDAVRPEGILLCLPTASEAEEVAILERLARW